MDKLRLYIWRLLYSPAKQKEKRQHLATKRVARLINGTDGGGVEPMTFGERVGLWLTVLVALGVLAGLYMLAAAGSGKP